MSSFWDRVDKVNEQKTAAEEEEKKKQEEKSSSFWDRVDKVNNGTIKVNASMSGDDVTNWYKSVTQTSKQAYDYLSKEGYKAPNSDYLKDLDSYLAQADHVGQYIRANKNAYSNYDEMIQGHHEVVNYLRSLKNSMESSNKYYSRWDTEEAYNNDWRDYGYQQKYGDLDYDGVVSTMEYKMEGTEEYEWLNNRATAIMPIEVAEAKRDAATTSEERLYYTDLINQKEVEHNAKLLDNTIMDGTTHVTVLDEMRYVAQLPDGAQKDARKNAIFAKMDELGMDRSFYSLITGDSYVTVDGVVSWAGNEAMSGLNNFNRGLFSTLDVIFGRPLQALGWENNPISAGAEYYSGLYDKYKYAANYAAEAMGGGAVFEIGGQLIEGTVAAVPDALLAFMTAGASATGSLATKAAYESGSILTKAGLTVQNMAKSPQYWLSFARTYGTDYEEAKAMGADDLTAAFGATISSLINAGIEIGFDGASGIQGLPQEVVEGGKSAILSWVKSSLEEGGEEVLQGFINNAVAKLLYNSDTELANLGDMATEFAMGTAVGGLLGGSQIGLRNTINTGANGIKAVVENRRNKRIYGNTEEDLRLLIAEGLESAEGSQSRILAEKLKQKLDSGKTLSGSEISQLVKANDEAIRLEETAEMKAETEAHLKELGETGDVSAIADIIVKRVYGDMLTSQEWAILANSKYGATLARSLASGHQVSRVNVGKYDNALMNLAQEVADKASRTKQVQHTEEFTPFENNLVAEAENATDSHYEVSEDGTNDQGYKGEVVEAIMHDLGISEPDADFLVQSFASLPNVSEAAYANGIREAFQYGSLGVKFEDISKYGFAAELPATLRKYAYNLGKMALETQKSNGYNGATKETEAENNGTGEGLHLRRGVQRTDSKSSGGSVREVVEGTGTVQNGQKETASRSGDGSKTNGQAKGKVSTSELGIPYGSEERSLSYADESTAGLKEAKAFAKKHGLELVAFAGGNLTVNDPDGVFEARAYIHGNKVIVRADHPEFSSMQLLKHELGHHKIRTGKVDMKKVYDAIVDFATEGYVQYVIESYVNAYATLEGYDADYILEEILCDYEAGMNIFSEEDVSSLFWEMAQEVMQSDSVKADPARGPPIDGDIKFSREPSKVKTFLRHFTGEVNEGEYIFLSNVEKATIKSNIKTGFCHIAPDAKRGIVSAHDRNKGYTYHFVCDADYSVTVIDVLDDVEDSVIIDRLMKEVSGNDSTGVRRSGKSTGAKGYGPNNRSDDGGAYEKARPNKSTAEVDDGASQSDQQRDSGSGGENRTDSGANTPRDTSEIKFSRETSYAEQVDKVKNNTHDPNNHVYMGTTPMGIAKILDLPKLPMLVTSQHIYSMAVSEQQARTENRYRSHTNYHQLGWDAVKDLPEYINKPVLIIKSTTDKNDARFIVVTAQVDKDGNPVAAAVKPNGTGNYFDIEIPANFMLSGYGKNNFQNFVAKAKTENRILYANKYSQKNKNTPSVQYADNILSSDYTTNLAEFKKIVNKKFEGTIFENSGLPKYIDGRFSREFIQAQMTEKEMLLEKTNRMLERENGKLREDNQYLKELVKIQKSLTGGAKFTRTSVEAAAKRLMAEASAKGDTKTLAKLLEVFYGYIAKGNEITWEGVMEQAQPVADWLAANEVKPFVREEYAQEVLDFLKGKSFYLDDTQKAEAKYAYGSYQAFRQKLLGTLNVSDKANMSLDSFWKEVSEEHPYYFPKEVTSGDQVAAIVDALKAIRTAEAPAEDMSGYEKEMKHRDLLYAVYDSYWSVSTLYSVADVKQKEINLLKTAHSKRMAQLRQNHSEQMQRMREQYAARMKELRAEYRERSERKQQQVIEKYREQKATALAKARETAEKRDARGKLQKLVIDTVKWLTYPAKTDVKCPDILKKPYADFLNSIDMSSKRLASGGDPTKADLRLSNAMGSLATALDKIMASQDPNQETDKVLDTGYLDLPANFVQQLRDMTENVKAMMVDGEYVVNNMPASEVTTALRSLKI